AAGIRGHARTVPDIAAGGSALWHAPAGLPACADHARREGTVASYEPWPQVRHPRQHLSVDLGSLEQFLVPAVVPCARENPLRGLHGFKKRSSDARSGWAVLRRATRSCTSGTGTTTPGKCREPRSADQSPSPRIWDTASASFSPAGKASIGNSRR